MLRLIKTVRLRAVPYRSLSFSAQRLLLSEKFALNDEWAKRNDSLAQFKLGSGYEWITSVQKKFISASNASAVDVDAALCLAAEADQVDDITNILYRLRHCEATSDMLPSTEYAAFRLLLRHNRLDIIFKLIEDPINYGVFLNEHSGCLVIDELLKTGNIIGAAKVAAITMQQEMFDSPLLNTLSVYALLKFIELPAAERVTEAPQEEEADYDDEEAFFKFPYLRLPYNDGHFDLTDLTALTAKSLDWLADHLDPKWRKDIKLVAASIRSEWSAVEAQLKKSDLKFNESTLKLVNSLVAEKAAIIPEDQQAESAEFLQLDNIRKATESAEGADVKRLSTKFSEDFTPHLPELESQLCAEQTRLFDEWGKHRTDLIVGQAKKLDLMLRVNEIDTQIQEIRDRMEILNFFDNRMQWEDKAREKDELKAEYGLNKADEASSEEEYARSMFETIRTRSDDVKDKAEKRAVVKRRWAPEDANLETFS